jgi:hypothetical protein
VLRESYDKPDRQGETTAYPSLDVFSADTCRRREFELLRATTGDKQTIAEHKLDGTTGAQLFTKATFIEAVKAARAAVPGCTEMSDSKLAAAARPVLCEELARVRTANPQLANATRARFARGEGYDTPLATLSADSHTSRGPIVKHEGHEYAPLETAYVQLRALSTLNSTAYDIKISLRPAGVGASASAAGSSSDTAAGPSTRTRAALASLRSTVLVAWTQGDQWKDAQHERHDANGHGASSAGQNGGWRPRACGGTSTG